ncbi:hypothetical protein WA026_011685 [Henosepilachna vigintioctopunctata]|uniref:Uncharacterized protein n=1 Tax=Henosepilachna vigintioctopunctata TaxID=420089 RepID=A0AAW1UGX5_9CUCU
MVAADAVVLAAAAKSATSAARLAISLATARRIQPGVTGATARDTSRRIATRAPICRRATRAGSLATLHEVAPKRVAPAPIAEAKLATTASGPATSPGTVQRTRRRATSATSRGTSRETAKKTTIGNSYSSILTIVVFY